MRASLPIGLSVLLIACAAPSPNPHVVHPKLGETLTSVPGPLPNFGPFASVAEAILAACPVIMRQPHALIPVPQTDQNFSVYWRTASEYCAWLYSVDGEHVDMSLMATSPIQNDLYAIADMARIHGITTRFRGQQTSMSIVAFIGKERGGQPECAGFYHYVPARSDEVLRYTVDNERLTKKAVARVTWSGEGNPSILPIEERP